MAGAQFEYDEKGTTFYYFILCFSGLILLPLTYFAWSLSSNSGEEKKEKSRVCQCDKCNEKRLRKSKQKPKITILRIASRITVVVLWIVLLYGVYHVSQFERDFVEYDPFAVLEIDKGASASEIKRQYRKLSLIYHPDKEGGDETKFMRIAKAYEALTNEESRKNWEEHGNPDGPQATTFGIALPSWIVSEENSLFVLGIYIFAFMIVLPVAVGTWWYRSIKYGNDQVLMDTTRIFFHFFAKTHWMPVKRVIMIFSASMEFEKKCNQEVQERPSDNEEIPKLLNELKNVNETSKEPPFGYPFSVKARALILSHFDRLNLPENTLQKDLDLILRKSPLLIQEMISCVSQLFYYHMADPGVKAPHLETFENVMKFSQMVVQATHHTSSLLQLPHILPEHLRYFASKKRNAKNIGEFLRMKKKDRRDMLRFLYDEQYEDVITVAEMIPHLEINVVPRVMDDEDEGVITAGAVVTVEVELIRKTLKDVCCKDEETDNEKPEEPEENTEHVEDGIEIIKTATKPKVWQKTKRKAKKAKPVKQQTKKKPVKQIVKKEETTQNKEEENVKREENFVKEKAPDNVVRRRKNNKDDNKADIDDVRDDIDDSDIDNQSNEDESVLGDSAHSDVDVDDDDEWQRMQEGVEKMEKVLDARSRTSHEVHAPYFPEDKQECWWVYVCDRKKQEITTAPTQVVNLKDVETVKLQFQAPEKCGHYSYTAVVRSDSYMDVDVSKLFKIEVHEAKKWKRSNGTLTRTTTKIRMMRVGRVSGTRKKMKVINLGLF
ncbi:translocation protein SEC63 homolog [Xenia sp. Carnegie-2017]|uniref:translocation protein SEC63 homolog n=1 Tax=Xenia sp. Carnegie-2017 TaxID=2897299 RepID=UPI001F046271|nr:translocation protein SEC63 homolog [Xenia sp. Carnegie-2017]